MAVKRVNFPNAPVGSIDLLQRKELAVGYPFTLTANSYCTASAYPPTATTHSGAAAAYPASAYAIEHCLQN